jgi:hypothetical protein
MDNISLDERALQVLPTLYQLSSRRGLIKKPIEEVVEIVNNLTGESDGRTRYQELEDAGYLDRTEAGTRVLPLAQKILCTISVTSLPPAAEGDSLAAQRLSEPPTLVMSRRRSRSDMSVPEGHLVFTRASSFKQLRRGPWYQLAGEVFPKVCTSCGIRVVPSEINTPALARNLRLWWEKDKQFGPTFIEAMMWEFGKHSQWAGRSRRPAWRVFLSYRPELVSLVLSAQAKVGVSRVRDNRSAWITYPSKVRAAAT